MTILILYWFLNTFGLLFGDSYEMGPFSEQLKNDPNWPHSVDAICGTPRSHNMMMGMDKIVGGTKSRIGQSPWIARIGYDRTRSLNVRKIPITKKLVFFRI